MSLKNYSVSVLIVDDDPEDLQRIHKEMETLFSKVSSSELNIQTATTAEEMLNKLRKDSYHVVSLDHELGLDPIMQPIYGVDFIPRAREIQPDARIIVTTTYKSTRLASEAIKKGAYDFVQKGPEYEQDRKAVYLRALKEARFELEMERRNNIQDQLNDSEFCYKSQAMKVLDKKLKALAEVHSNVLFIGEAGLGKTYAAKRLSSLTAKHNGQEDGHNFQNINITATPDNLQAAALFGYEKGAFTGATQTTKGLIERAEGGCLFLDEVGDASPEVQSLLLKVVEEKVYQRIGGKETLYAKTRFIFATNKDLKKMVHKGTFRRDLYDRISAIIISIPTQMERRKDLPYICQNITNKLKKSYGRNISYNDFPDDLKKFLTSGKIKGNIRGIENCLINLASFAKKLPNGKLDYSIWREKLSEEQFYDANDYQPSANSMNEAIETIVSKVDDKDWIGLPSLTKAIEKRLVQKVFNKFKDNKSRAKALGVALPTIYQKNAKYLKEQ